MFETEKESLRSARAILIGRICLVRRLTGNAGEGMRKLRHALAWIERQAANLKVLEADLNGKHQDVLS